MSKMTFMKKGTSLFLIFTLIFMSSVIASAATVTLSKSNITEYPTVVYATDDEGSPLTLYYGMRTGDVISLTGGKVEYNGTEVPGHFELTNPDEIANVGGVSMWASFTFYPDDTTTYSQFSVRLSKDVTYYIGKGIPTFVDEVNNPVIASSIKSGETLAQSTLTGGQVMNAFAPSEPKILNATWKWVDSSTVVNESGYYQAQLTMSYYETLYKDVWVEVEGLVTETEIVNIPDFNLAYDGVTKWVDLDLSEAKAVEKGTDKEVPGTFSFAWQVTGAAVNDTALVEPGDNNLILIFTPDDTETYLKSETLITVNVAKGIPSWKDGITPVVTVPYGTTVVAETFHNFRFDGTLVADETLNFNLCDAEGNILFDGVKLDCGTYTDYQLRAASKSTQSNWQPALLPITIVVEPTEAEISVVYNSKTNQLNVSASSRYLYGTFDIYIDGQLIFDNAAIERYLDTMRFLASWLPDSISQNLTHDIKVVYNPAENDNAYIANDFEGTFTFEAERTINETEKSIYFYKGNASFTPGEDQLFAGEEIRVFAGMPDFLYWEITDSKGNEIELEFVKGDMNSKEITFVMPEFDINIDYVTQTDLDRQEAIDNCGCLCHNDNPIVQFFWRIILFFMNLFHIENVCDCGYPHGS